jgi:hypothetical protein
MLTADAAAKHGHDYSPPRLPSPASPRHGAFSLAQMPLSLLGSVLRYQTSSPSNGEANDSASKHVTAAASPMPSSSSRPHAHAQTDSPSASPAPSRPASSGSSAAADEKRKKKAPRPKTSYVIAHPPPTEAPSCTSAPRSSCSCTRSSPPSAPSPSTKSFPSPYSPRAPPAASPALSTPGSASATVTCW